MAEINSFQKLPRMRGIKQAIKELKQLDADADNRRQAQTVLNAHNQAWGDDNILLQYSEAECRTEMARRERMQNIEKM